ncbi:MAG: archaeosortase/exosortase family protein [Deltaproteobacteria bacterium]|nr:archaeosortase/exosortase family protein [Deltaproteobacteria bacterium]
MLKLDREIDTQVWRWVVKFILVYVLVSQVLWNINWFRAHVVNPMRPILAWELEKTGTAFGLVVHREDHTLFVEGSPLSFRVDEECTGFFGGFFIFLAVAVTVPASSFRRRILWLVLGAVVMEAANLTRLTVVLVISSRSPASFDLMHELSDIFNMIVGGGLSFAAVYSLALAPRGIRPFRRQPQKPEGGLPA